MGIWSKNKMNESWLNGYNEFNKNVKPLIVKHSDKIKESFQNQDKDAIDILSYCYMLSKSYDPVSHMMCEEALTRWLKNNVNTEK